MTAPTVTRTRSRRSNAGPTTHAVSALSVTFDRVGPERKPRSRAKPLVVAPMVITIPPHTAMDADAIAGFIRPMIAIVVGRWIGVSRPEITIDVDTTGSGSVAIDGGHLGSAKISPVR